MYYQHDWFMLQIQMMVQFIAKVTFQKDPFEIDALFDTEWGHTETDPLEKEIAALFAQSRFQEAESLVLKRLSSKQPAALKKMCIRDRDVTMDLPTPPFPLTMPMTFFTEQPSFSCSLGKPPSLEGQLSPQVSQLWVQFSLIAILSLRIRNLVVSALYYNTLCQKLNPCAVFSPFFAFCQGPGF